MFDTKNIALFAILGSIGAFWAQIKNFLTKFLSFFIRSDEIIGDGESGNFARYLFKNGKLINWGNKKYNLGYVDYLKPYDVMYHFLFSSQTDYLIKIGKTFVLIKPNDNNGIRVIYLYGTFNFRKHLEISYKEALLDFKKWEKKEMKRFFVSQKTGAQVNMGYAGITPQNLSTPTNSSKGNNLLDQYFLLKTYNDIVGLKHSDIGKDSQKNVRQEEATQPQKKSGSARNYLM